MRGSDPWTGWPWVRPPSVRCSIAVAGVSPGVGGHCHCRNGVSSDVCAGSLGGKRGRIDRYCVDAMCGD